MRLKWKLVVASMKMFFRQREAILWTFLLPLFMVTLFGFVRFGGTGSVEVGVAAEAPGSADALVKLLRDAPALKISEGTRETEAAQLQKGDRDLVLVVPRSFVPGMGGELKALTNNGRPGEARLGILLVQGVLDNAALSGAAKERTVIHSVQVVSRNLTYIDFLLPGVLSMSIMQMGIFGVAFGFVSLKKRGILRRLSATPVEPADFIIAQVVMRLLVVLLQVGLMVGAGLLFFHLHLAGNILALLVPAVLGAITFLAVGFALAGISRSEDQVAPLANIITLPMLLLSGIFFSRSALPGVIHTITGWFPLTFLADSMRSIAIDGASLVQVAPDLLGLAAWAVAACLLAIRLFRWE